MGRVLARLIINAAGLWVAAQVVPGIHFGAEGEGTVITILVVALIFGVVNALIKPVLAAITCPFYVLTLGLFTFVVNALMLLMTAQIATALDLPFIVSSFGAAFWGSIIISIVSFLLSIFIDDERD